MKKITKKVSQLFCGLLGVAFLATGCATVGNIKNTETEVIYNGNAVVSVGGYLYYGNSLADIENFSGDSDYTKSAKLSYLARLNTNIERNATSKDYSPKNVENVSKEVAGQKNNFMFVYENYIYYVTPKREQETNSDGKLENQFTHSVIYRSKLNGDSKKKLYTTSADISNIEVLKHTDGKYYIVFLAGSDLVKISIGNKCKVSTIATDVTSVGLPKTYQKDLEQSTLSWNGNIYYTTTRKDENNSDISGTTVYKVSVAGGEAKQVWTKQGSTLTIVGREKDNLYYTIGSVSYVLDTNKEETIVMDGDEYSICGATISDVNLIATSEVDYGVVFTSNNKINYMTRYGNSGTINFVSNNEPLTATIKAVSGRRVYLVSETGIYSADISKVFEQDSRGEIAVECETLVSMTKISQELFGFDGKYVYYYATLEDIEEDEEGSEEESKEDKSITDQDSNLYLYRARIAKSGDYELLSYTEISSRH